MKRLFLIAGVLGTAGSIACQSGESGPRGAGGSGGTAQSGGRGGALHGNASDADAAVDAGNTAQGGGGASSQGGSAGDQSQGSDAGVTDAGGSDASLGVPCVDAGVCEDNNACTADECVSGVCANTPIDFADDDNACTTEVCDPLTGDIHPAVDVDDNNVCTVDSCDPIIGVDHARFCADLCNTNGACLTRSAVANFSSSPALAIVDFGVVSNSIAVSGIGTYLWDLNIETFITCDYAGDLDITLQSPAGTIITLTSDNGLIYDGIFNGTTWDDSANPAGLAQDLINNGLVTDTAYANGVVATPLAPEEALGAFIGEDPNGTWTLTISEDFDDQDAQVGALAQWGLDIVTLSGEPTKVTEEFTQSTDATIADQDVVTSTLTVPALPGSAICKVTVDTDITHTAPSDLAITVTAPGGRIVTLSSKNGAATDDVFAGTLWDDDANPAGQVPYANNNGLATDHTYLNAPVATPLAPEEGLAAFIGDDPVGVWTLTIADRLAGDVGTLRSWGLNISSCLK